MSRKRIVLWNGTSEETLDDFARSYSHLIPELLHTQVVQGRGELSGSMALKLRPVVINNVEGEFAGLVYSGTRIRRYVEFGTQEKTQRPEGHLSLDEGPLVVVYNTREGNRNSLEIVVRDVNDDLRPNSEFYVQPRDIILFGSEGRSMPRCSPAFVAVSGWEAFNFSWNVHNVCTAESDAPDGIASEYRKMNGAIKGLTADLLRYIAREPLLSPIADSITDGEVYPGKYL